MNTPSTAHGSCLCGAVRFTAHLPCKWVVHCHCTRCQRAHGAAFVTWVGLDETQVQINDTQGALRWFRTPEYASQRGFCSICGSPMFFQSEREAGELHIARALFTTPIEREPESHEYYDTHVSWIKSMDSLPKEST